LTKSMWRDKDIETLEKRLAIAESMNRSYEITINKLKNPNSPIYIPSSWEKAAKKITDQRDALIEIVNDIIGGETTSAMLLIHAAEIREELNRIEAMK